MKIRVLTAAGIALFGIPLLIFSHLIIYSIALGVLSLMAIFELLRVLGLDKRYAVSAPAYLVALAMPLFAHSIFGIDSLKYIPILAGVLFAYLLYLAFLAVFNRGELKFDSIAEAFMGVAYVTSSFTALSIMRYMPYGAYIFGLVFVSAWVCDTFAYFTGRLFGKHKLAPAISPKKTVEGSIGGIFFTVLAFLLYGFIVDKAFSLEVNYLVMALSGLLLSVVAQLGDLFASLIKRERGVKDYSNLLPGHGGIMDRFDSILAVSVVLMVICILFPPFCV